MKKPCPYLGSKGDPSTYYLCSDPGNRCYARQRQTRLGRLLNTKPTPERIGKKYQREYCYENFGECEYYKKKTTPAAG